MSALEEYKGRIGRGRRKPWTPPGLDDFAQGTEVLSFDQTLRNIGVVQLCVQHGEVVVTDRTTLRLKTDAEGFEGTFDLADQLDGALIMVDLRSRWPDYILVEMPAVTGHRIESSLLAAYVIRRYFQKFIDRPRMVSIQHSRTLLAGPGTGNDKKSGYQALARYIPESASRKWNEHQRDAAINALAHLYAIKEGR